MSVERRSFRWIRTVARCRSCKQETVGVTTIERHPNARQPEYRYHFCDNCRNTVVARPLVAVLHDYLED